MEPENCGSVEDFLLSPWVLIQLPFRPPLYHQWTLALLAETLKFQMDISDLMIIDTPLTLHPTLARLKIMSSLLYSNAQFHLENYMKCIAHKWKIESNNAMMGTFPGLIPTLKFVLSAECKVQGYSQSTEAISLERPRCTMWTDVWIARYNAHAGPFAFLQHVLLGMPLPVFQFVRVRWTGQ